MCNRAGGGAVLFILGAGILAFSVSAPGLVKSLLRKQLQYVPGTTLYASWLTPATRDFNIYIMNVTNPTEVLNGSKPILQELGPYIYDEFKRPEKDDIRLSADQDTLYYRSRTSYVFNADKTRKASKGAELDPLSDIVTAPDILFHTVLAMCSNPHSALAAICGLFEFGSLVEFDVKPFETVSVDGLIWGHQTNFSIFMNELSQGLIPAEVSLLHNYTLKRESAIKTGHLDQNMVGQYVLWLGRKHLTAWGSKYANMINGTSGSGFRPYLHRDNVQSLPVFVSEVNRTFDLFFTGNQDVSGISCRRYVLPKAEMQNATQNPAQAVWYGFGPSGLMNMSTVQGGAPIFMSKPHFLQGDPALLANVSILSSTAEISKRKDTTLDVEPITGITLDAMKTLQTNVYVQPYNGTLADQLEMQYIRHTYLPVFWVQEAGTVSDSDAAKLRNSAILPYNIFTSNYMYIAVVCGGLAVVLSCMLLISFVRKYREKKRTQGHLLVDFSDEDETG